MVCFSSHMSFVCAATAVVIAQQYSHVSALYSAQGHPSSSSEKHQISMNSLFLALTAVQYSLAKAADDTHEHVIQSTIANRITHSQCPR